MTRRSRKNAANGERPRSRRFRRPTVTRLEESTSNVRTVVRGLPIELLDYGGRLVSKLHSDAFAKLEHVLLSFEYAFFHLGSYALFVWVCSLHLGMYAICIWVCSFHSIMLFLHLGIVFLFGYALFVWVCSLHLGMYAICIWVSSLHLGIIFLFGYAFAFGYVALFIWVCSLHLGIIFLFGYAFAFGYVCSFHLGMLFAFECALFIWVWHFHLDILISFGYGLYIWIYYSFCMCKTFHAEQSRPSVPRKGIANIK